MRSKPWKRILTAEEEVGLAALMRGPDVLLDQELPEGYRATLDATDDRALAFDALMLHNIRLVWSIARTYVADGLEPEDIAHHGMIGLRRAVEKFDATKGYKFSTYATHWIRQSISRGIENDSRLIRLPAHIIERMNQVLRIRDRMVMENGSFTVAALASETGLPFSKVMEFLRLEAGTVSLDKPVKDDGDTLGTSSCSSRTTMQIRLR
jgi:RNA polymerase primary sigma factor